jgi:hypothetical protein
MNKEIRCYGNNRVANGLIGIMVGGFSVMLLAGVVVGNYYVSVVLGVCIYPLLWLLWYASRRGTFIVVDLGRRTLQGSNCFIRTRRIPIKAITRIGTRGMFAGAATEIEIIYREPNGREKTVGYGTTNFLDHQDLQKLLDAIVAINPLLHIPSELRNKLSQE